MSDNTSHTPPEDSDQFKDFSANYVKCMDCRKVLNRDASKDYGESWRDHECDPADHPMHETGGTPAPGF